MVFINQSNRRFDSPMPSLHNTPLGLYIAITTFLNNDLIEPKILKEEIGIDMGIKITLLFLTVRSLM
jgi:hypothetical protein